MYNELTKEDFVRAYNSGREDLLLPFRNAGMKYLFTHRCYDKDLQDSAVGLGMVDAFENIADFDSSIAPFSVFLGNKCFAAYQRVRRKEQGRLTGRVNLDEIKEGKPEDARYLTDESPERCVIDAERQEYISETFKKVIQCISFLPSDKRRVMQVVLREGLTSDELNKLESLKRRDGGVSQFISDEKGISLENARQLIHRSKRALQEMMQRHYSIDPFSFHQNLTRMVVRDDIFTEEDIDKLSYKECILVLAEILS